jgi:hypothetical protein
LFSNNRSKKTIATRGDDCRADALSLPGETVPALLEDALNRTGVHGVLLTVSKSQDLNAGHLFLELQAGRLDGATTRRIQELILQSRKKPK